MKQPVSVMIVDDEIMALNHLKNLVDWEGLGFKLVASETNPRKALESFYGQKPRIVFVDVQMPVMNGLDLSSRILSSGIPVKVVVLTSYKDFQYAKKSIEIGVAGYLVKHELNNESLINELIKLKTELLDEEKRERIIRQRLIRFIICGTPPPEFEGSKISNKYLSYEVRALFFIFFRVDTPFQITGEETDENIKDKTDLRKAIEQSDPGVYADIISLSSGDSVIVTYLGNYDQRDSRPKDVSRIFAEIHRQVEKQNKTVSACSIVRENKLDELLDLYSEVQNVFTHNVFTGRSEIYHIDELSLKKEMAVNEEIDDYLIRIEKISDQLDIEQTVIILDELFTYLSVPPWSIAALRHVCIELMAISDKLLRKNQVLSPYQSEEGKALSDRSEKLFNIEDISAWFVDTFRYSIKLIQENQGHRYSKKVLLALEYIHSHYQEDWAVEEIADNLNISEVYLRKIFKSETGSTIVNYLTEYRMKKAQYLLDTGEYKIYEIAKMVGYKTSQYFSKVFRKYTGKNPVDY